ncbi:DsrE family protein [Ferruginibacter lapsinanis]|uniref:DsrE family protein n=1 Tax=Ferruginibacter lapsinanis TaxID=563172 RepID=UPI001E59265A|nr:DsrE family protein [Ferruginibacter lapsinanis]UEG49207.1 DsrE family protein [Ferruginibacter lapsinanis]
MKANILFIMLQLLLYSTAYTQLPNYKVVFDISSKDSVSQQAVVREVELIKNANPDASLEVVVYGQAINLVVNNQSKQLAAIQQLLTKKNVNFKVCAVTMKRNNITADQLIAGIEVVPDGIYEIITKEHEGWGYIKVAH